MLVDMSSLEVVSLPTMEPREPILSRISSSIKDQPQPSSRWKMDPRLVLPSISTSNTILRLLTRDSLCSSCNKEAKILVFPQSSVCWMESQTLLETIAEVWEHSSIKSSRTQLKRWSRLSTWFRSSSRWRSLLNGTLLSILLLNHSKVEGLPLQNSSTKREMTNTSMSMKDFWSKCQFSKLMSSQRKLLSYSLKEETKALLTMSRKLSCNVKVRWEWRVDQSKPSCYQMSDKTGQEWSKLLTSTSTN